MSLERWLQAAAEAAGATDVDPSLLGPEAVDIILDLARVAAHNVERPAAPLAAFALGLALGRTNGSADNLHASAARVGSLAKGSSGSK